MKKIVLLIMTVLVYSITVNAQMKKIKVVIDNDFCGDPDGLFELVQHVLSPTTNIVGIVGGHLSDNAGFTKRKDQATESVEIAKSLLDVMGVKDKFKVVPGSETAMITTDKIIGSQGARLIVDEAMKCTPESPLYVLCGASLTNIADALLINSSISKNIIVVWIGGQEYSFGAMPPPGYSTVEYNLNLSISAAQVVFNKSDVRIWQVPRDAYRQCLYSVEEMYAYIKPCGKIGTMLSDAIDHVMEICEKLNIPMGEVYIMGDSPLVLLTSLQSGFEADPSSSRWMPTPCPLIDNHGAYQPNPTGRTIRVYTQLDCRLMFRDMEARLQNFARRTKK